MCCIVRVPPNLSKGHVSAPVIGALWLCGITTCNPRPMGAPVDRSGYPFVSEKLIRHHPPSAENGCGWADGELCQGSQLQYFLPTSLRYRRLMVYARDGARQSRPRL